MKRIVNGVFLLAIIAMISSTALSEGWQGKSGVGLRGPLISPLFVGSKFAKFDGNEPYMMGYDGNVFLRYGITNHIVVDLSVGLATTYDDSTATGNQSFKLNKSDNAYSKLEGLLFGLTGNYYFLTERKMQPYILGGFGFDAWTVRGRAINESIDITDLSVKFGGGLNYWIRDNMTIDLQAKFSYALHNVSNTVETGVGNPSDWGKLNTRPFRGYVEPSIGFTYYIGHDKDTDGDGVSDKHDQCPDTPIGCIVDTKGCPIDSDGDGVCDGLDRCPNTPRGCVVDISGCPFDKDGDGIFDGLDKCPNTPKGCLVDASGCPLDSDGDGVCDGLDKCLNTPKGCNVDATGCPLDGDGDGVYDGLDKCPNTPRGVEVDINGCPKNVKAPVQKITLNIKYASGSFEPDQPAKKVLDDLAETMKAYTSVKIEIGGFTDDVGKEQANQVLSQKRAETIMKYLESKGVPSDRITAKGYGENPRYFIGDNKTAEGKQKNRRVEITSSEF